MGNSQETQRVLVSYLTLRKVVGALGVLLPIIVAVGCLIVGSCDGLLESISAYYGTPLGDVFVGILFTIAWFLFTYRGYEPQDNIAGTVACAFALGVALFPVTSDTRAVRALHLFCAAALFLVLSYFSLCLFTKSSGSPTREKLKRNKVYRSCGVAMLACIALIALYYWFLRGTAIAAAKPVFWLESLALWAFGVSWAIKGEMLLQDAQ